MGSEIIFIIALIIAVAAVYWIVLKSSAEKIATQYQLLAERFGLELNQAAVKMRGFIRSEPSVFGTYRGREMSISVPGKGPTKYPPNRECTQARAQRQPTECPTNRCWPTGGTTSAR
ncbi:MAG: hypothetical protein ACJ0BK_08930 [Coraliomargaritaceae bacterium]